MAGVWLGYSWDIVRIVGPAKIGKDVGVQWWSICFNHQIWSHLVGISVG